MSSETRTRTDVGTTVGLNDWQAGVVGGLIGGVLMGTMLSALNPAALTTAIPTMYGLESGVAGWTAHLAHSAILGVVFAAIISMVFEHGGRPAISGAIGLVYGAVLWVVLAAFVMPVWVNAVAGATVLPSPNLGLPGSLPPHLVYGVVLGVLYPYLR